MSDKQNQIDRLHDTLLANLADVIEDHLAAGQRLKLSPGEITGIVAAALTLELTRLVVQAALPEHLFLTWCHDQFIKMRDMLTPQRQH